VVGITWNGIQVLVYGDFMKALIIAISFAFVSSSALAFPENLECSTNEDTDGAINVTVKNDSVELAMHEMSFASISRKANSSKDSNTLAFSIKKTTVSAEGDAYPTDLDLNLTYNASSKKLSMALALSNKDLGIGAGGGFLNCK
jgi:hypothetical protein